MKCSNFLELYVPTVRLRKVPKNYMVGFLTYHSVLPVLVMLLYADWLKRIILGPAWYSPQKNK